MGKKMTRDGMELRRAVRADLDASPGIDHLAIRRKHGVAEGIVESALTKTLAEWDALLAVTPDEKTAAPMAEAIVALDSAASAGAGAAPQRATAHEPAMPGIEQGVVKFLRKPAKMGQDHIFWIPRVYIKNGLVDPTCEYEVYLKKRA